MAAAPHLALLPGQGLGLAARADATSVLSAFVFDPAPTAPVTLGASLVEAHRVSDKYVYTLSVDCAPGASPENDACRARSVYPAAVWHTRGSVWGGTVTARAEGLTTTYSCDLGSCGSRGGRECGPQCALTVESAGFQRPVTTTYLTDACVLSAHNALLLVSAGADSLPAAYYYTRAVDDMVSIFSSVRAEAAATCPQIAAAAASSSTTTTAASSGATTSSPASTGSGGQSVTQTGASGTQSQQSSQTGAGTGTGTVTDSTAKNTGSLGVLGGVSWMKAATAAAVCLAAVLAS